MFNELIIPTLRCKGMSCWWQPCGCKSTFCNIRNFHFQISPPIIFMRLPVKSLQNIFFLSPSMCFNVLSRSKKKKRSYPVYKGPTFERSRRGHSRYPYPQFIGNAMFLAGLSNQNMRSGMTRLNVTKPYIFQK